ncbi:hypothetical protein RISK_003766 [Rhodopirellula islandica]|uniref:Uncharacterized protein n=1 Tax=Rhodopirellula islandica TaxID=595434 RepID=A0A0J1BC11_RHOIS|nr:hypothetical protein RISK_003766 [Rhodopirellula islandica]
MDRRTESFGPRAIWGSNVETFRDIGWLDGRKPANSGA